MVMNRKGFFRRVTIGGTLVTVAPTVIIEMCAPAPAYIGLVKTNWYKDLIREMPDKFILEIVNTVTFGERDESLLGGLNDQIR